MKKTLIALAALAAAGAASAQSSVTLFGIIDASVSRYVVGGNSNGPGTNNNVLTNSGYNSSRLGFRGTEDLGGGLSASFWLEGQLQNDNGQGVNQTTGLNFQRRSTVSLAGSSWGEVRLGRDYAPTFWNMTVFDPFGTVGVGANLGHKWRLFSGPNGIPSDPNYVRASNSIGYFLPANLGGFYGQAMFAFDEVVKNTPPGSNNENQGRYWGGRLGYGSGPFNVALAYGQTDGTPTRGFPNTAPAGLPRVTDWNLGGQWDFGVARLMGTYDDVKYDGGSAVANAATPGLAGSVTLKSWMIGGIMPVGAGEIKASYGRSKFDLSAGSDPDSSQWAIGYVHNLSKRTALYTTYARVHNSNGSFLPINASLNQGPVAAGANGITPVQNASSWGLDIGIRHSF